MSQAYFELRSAVSNRGGHACPYALRKCTLLLQYESPKPQDSRMGFPFRMAEPSHPTGAPHKPISESMRASARGLWARLYESNPCSSGIDSCPFPWRVSPTHVTRARKCNGLHPVSPLSMPFYVAIVLPGLSHRLRRSCRDSRRGPMVVAPESPTRATTPQANHEKPGSLNPTVCPKAVALVHGTGCAGGRLAMSVCCSIQIPLLIIRP